MDPWDRAGGRLTRASAPGRLSGVATTSSRPIQTRMELRRRATAIVLALGCLALTTCDRQTTDQAVEFEPVPQERLIEIEQRRVEAAQVVHRELSRRGIAGHSPIDCGVFPDETKGQRDSRCNVSAAEASGRDVIVVTLDPASNAVTSWQRSPVTAGSGQASVVTGWCPGDTESFESAKRLCGEASTPDPRVNPAG